MTRAPRESSWFGHPKGMFLVAATEMWERFSFYGMLGLLVLFLTAPPATGGFGWTRPEALKLYGTYMFLVFVSPVVGGWLASAYFGERVCILVGGVTVASGHFLLGGLAWIPALMESLSGMPTEAVLTEAGIARGHIRIPAEAGAAVRDALSALGIDGTNRALQWVRFAYGAGTLTFYLGILLIVVGTGFIKPTITSIVERLYPPGDIRREAGFTIFLVAVYVGSFTSSFVAGTLGERVGWHAGLSAAGFGMVLGVLFYLWKQNEYLGDIGKAPERRHRRTGGGALSLTAEERDRVKAVGVLCGFAIVYAIAFYQKGGLINQITYYATDRRLLGFEIPATWFLAVSTGVFILLSPVGSHLFERARRRGRPFDVVQKMALGLTVIAVGYVFLLGSVVERGDDLEAKSSWLWIAATYSFFGVADLLFWPTTFSAAARLAPEGYTPLTIGAWYTIFGIGTWLAGYIGAWSYSIGGAPVFLGILAACLAAAGLLMGIRARFLGLMHEPAA